MGPHLPAQLSDRRYDSASWHHDRCGRRLKLFIFLSEVHEGTHSTRIAVGSHRTLYYDYSDMPGSRFAASYVEAGYETVSMQSTHSARSSYALSAERTL